MKYYFVGIKGAGLSALAVILKELGHEITGYDDAKTFEFTENKLIDNQIKYYTAANNAMDTDSIIIRSAAIKDTHPEIKKAQAMDLKIYEYNEMLGNLSEQYESITVSGCHGKTTTTSMLATVLNNTIGINYLIGDGSGYVKKENTKFVFEACEYRRHFLVYDPTYAIITNIELDHTDYFKDIEDYKNAFEEYANKAKKMVIAYGDDPYIHDLKITKPIIYFGTGDSNDVVAKNIKYSADGITFDCYIKGNLYSTFDLPFYGEHNLLNALATITTCYVLGLEGIEVANNLKLFNGAARRFSEITIGDNIIVDDYAHHSKEVEVTIKAARQKYPDKKIVSVFEPHSFSRVVDLDQEFADALNLSDYSYVLPIYPSRDNPADYPGITNDMIISKLKVGEEITNDTSSKLFTHTNTVFLFMSLKEIHKIKDDLLNYLNKAN